MAHKEEKLIGGVLTEVTVFDQSAQAIDDAVGFVAGLSAAVGSNTLLHTGNKPVGTYTGNGSAASRKIATGGIGNAVVIRSSNGSAILTAAAGLVFSGTGGVSAIGYAVAHIENGTITLTTTNDKLNANGVVYTYQVI